MYTPTEEASGLGVNGNGRLRFGEYELDREGGKLLRSGWPVKLQPQPFRVLALLLERPGEIFSRDEIRARVWGEATFVEFDQGLNYCIRQIRLALRDAVANPVYIETLPKQGYRFIASVAMPLNGAHTHTLEEVASEPPNETTPPALPEARQHSAWPLAIVAGLGAAVVLIVSVLFLRSTHPKRLQYTQITDFTDSASSPALSSDGRMLVFLRGDAFLSTGAIYVKMLPDGEPRVVTDDPRPKYGAAFSPDSSEIAYSVLAPAAFATYAVSVFGGQPRLLLQNAAGLTWLDRKQLLFSQIKSGLHMGVVTGTVTRGNFRELYFPARERGMAHYAYASPDHKSALVVEMDGDGDWGPCRLISLDGRSQTRPIGPAAPCTSAGWSPDGNWMYFSAAVKGSHLWRQRFPKGAPEQLTFGPTEEDGIAVEPDGRSLITSLGQHGSAIWIHDGGNERCLSSEGEVLSYPPPVFNRSGTVLYYLLRRNSAGSQPELWRMDVQSGASEPVFPGVGMTEYDVSPNEQQIVYSTTAGSGKSQVWLAPMDRSSPPKLVGFGARQPYFGPRGQILFLQAEGKSNYLEQCSRDGSGRSKVVPYPVGELRTISAGRRWVAAMAVLPGSHQVNRVVIPTEGGPARVLCQGYCEPQWSSNGDWLFVAVDYPTRTSSGRSLAIPVGAGESLPELPLQGLRPGVDAGVVPGAVSVARADFVAARDLNHFAYVKTTVHSNLYRISLP